MSLADERAGLWAQPGSAAAELLHPVTLEAGARHMSHVDQDGFPASLLTRHHRTDDLPITRRMLGVDLDGSRRI